MGIRSALACAAVAGACTPTTPPATATLAPPPAAVPSAATAARLEAKPNPCPRLRPGTTSDEDAPVLVGVGAPTELMPWLEARGVSRASALSWYAQHFHDDLAHAETVFGDDMCNPVTVGDAAEEAIACETTETYTWMRIHAVVLVVRKKRLTSVLDVGLAMRALDWPDARHLDLTLAFETGGRAAVLRERAPEGTLLVESQSECRAREAFFDACEDALAKQIDLDPSCQVTIGPNTGEKSIVREVPHSPLDDGKAELHGCDSARESLKEAVAEMKGIRGPLTDDARGARAFVERTCNGLGRYVWKGDRFVRSG